MKTMIDAVAHDVTEGKVLVGGVAYAIKQGKTMKDGVAYDIGTAKVPTQAELWADAVCLSTAGTNARPTAAPILTFGQVSLSGNEAFVFSFCNGYVAVYCVTGVNVSNSGFEPTGIELIYNVPGSTTPGAILDAGTVHFATSITATAEGEANGATLLAVEFPSYSKEQIVGAFGNLALASETDGTSAYSSRAGRNTKSTGNCSQYYFAFVNCEVMFAAVNASAKVYTSGLGNSYDTLTPVFQTDSNSILGSVVASSGSKYNVQDTTGSTYGASLIGLKEAA